MTQTNPNLNQTFGISTRLKPQSVIYYHALFSAYEIGRVTDLLSYSIRESKVNFEQIRSILGHLLSHAIKNHHGVSGLDPVTVEISSEELRTVMGVSYSFSPEAKPQLLRLSQNLQAGISENLLEAVSLEASRFAAEVIVNYHIESSRIEIVVIVDPAAVLLARNQPEPSVIQVNEIVGELQPNSIAMIYQDLADTPAPEIEELSKLGALQPFELEGAKNAHATVGGVIAGLAVKKSEENLKTFVTQDLLQALAPEEVLAKISQEMGDQKVAQIFAESAPEKVSEWIKSNKSDEEINQLIASALAPENQAQALQKVSPEEVGQIVKNSTTFEEKAALIQASLSDELKAQALCESMSKSEIAKLLEKGLTLQEKARAIALGDPKRAAKLLKNNMSQEQIEDLLLNHLSDQDKLNILTDTLTKDEIAEHLKTLIGPEQRKRALSRLNDSEVLKLAKDNFSQKELIQLVAQSSPERIPEVFENAGTPLPQMPSLDGLEPLADLGQLPEMRQPTDLGQYPDLSVSGDSTRQSTFSKVMGLFGRKKKDPKSRARSAEEVAKLEATREAIGQDATLIEGDGKDLIDLQELFVEGQTSSAKVLDSKIVKTAKSQTENIDSDVRISPIEESDDATWVPGQKEIIGGGKKKIKGGIVESGEEDEVVIEGGSDQVPSDSQVRIKGNAENEEGDDEEIVIESKPKKKKKSAFAKMRSFFKPEPEEELETEEVLETEGLLGKNKVVKTIQSSPEILNTEKITVTGEISNVTNTKESPLSKDHTVTVSKLESDTKVISSASENEGSKTVILQGQGQASGTGDKVIIQGSSPGGVKTIIKSSDSGNAENDPNAVSNIAASKNGVDPQTQQVIDFFRNRANELENSNIQLEEQRDRAIQEAKKAVLLAKSIQERHSAVNIDNKVEPLKQKIAELESELKDKEEIQKRLEKYENRDVLAEANKESLFSGLDIQAQQDAAMLQLKNRELEIELKEVKELLELKETSIIEKKPSPGQNKENAELTKKLGFYEKRVVELQLQLREVESRLDQTQDILKKSELEKEQSRTASYKARYNPKANPAPGVDAASTERQEESLEEGFEYIRTSAEQLKREMADERAHMRIDKFLSEIMAKKSELKEISQKMNQDLKQKEHRFKLREIALEEELKKTKIALSQKEHGAERSKESITRMQERIESERAEFQQRLSEASQFKLHAEASRRMADELQKENDKLKRQLAASGNKNTMSLAKPNAAQTQLEATNKALLGKKQEVEQLKRQLNEKAVAEQELLKKIARLEGKDKKKAS